MLIGKSDTHMVKRYFKHPQPLSPSERARTVFDDDGVGWVKDSGVRGGRRRVKGVVTTQSIYYLWFEYLKRSKKYKRACGYEVEMSEAEERAYDEWRRFKGTNDFKMADEVLNAFGDIFKYKTDSNGFTDAHEFYRWWKDRGVECFGVQGADMSSAVTEFSSIKDIKSLTSEIDDYEIVLLPKDMPRTLMRQRVGKLISGMPKVTVKQKEAQFRVTSDRVDVESLSDCLAVYDMMSDITNNYTAVQVYANLFGIKKEHRHLDLFTDARSERGMLRDWLPSAECLNEEAIEGEENEEEEELEVMTGEERLQQEAAKAYAEQKMKWREAQRVKGSRGDGTGYKENTRNLTADELDKLRDIYIGIYLGTAVKSPQSEDRAKAKNYYKQQTYRLLRKAKANIEAVEIGTFGIGHETRK